MPIAMSGMVLPAARSTATKPCKKRQGQLRALKVTTTNNKPFEAKKRPASQPKKRPALDAAKKKHLATEKQPISDVIDWGSPGLPVATSTTAVVASQQDLVIIEPWEHVGHNALGEEVRASVNAALVARQAGFESVCLPLHNLGRSLGPPGKVVQALAGKKLILEGGAPDVFDATTFSHEDCPRDYVFGVYKRLLLSRHLTGVQIFICLSHQLVVACLVELIKSAVVALAEHGGESEAAVAREVHRVGRRLRVTKHNGTVVVATGYDDRTADGWEQFATAKNESVEAALLRLHPFELPADVAARLDAASGMEAARHTPDSTPSSSARASVASETGGASSAEVPDPKVHAASSAEELDAELLLVAAHHRASAREQEGEIERAIAAAAERGVHIAMFHGVEVNVEAAYFCSWALSRIATVASSVDWLRQLPVGYEIVGSTRDPQTGKVVTDVACARLDYNLGGRRLSSYTCQFHPELTESLRDARAEPPDGDGDQDDGRRLLASMLRADADGRASTSPCGYHHYGL